MKITCDPGQGDSKTMYTVIDTRTNKVVFHGTANAAVEHLAFAIQQIEQLSAEVEALKDEMKNVLWRGPTQEPHHADQD